MDERHLDEATKVQCGLVEPRKDSSRLFQPADETLDDIPAPVRSPIKFHRTGSTVFVLLRRNHWLDAELQQVRINPVGAIPFVTAKLHRPSYRLAFAVLQLGIRSFQERVQCRGIMGLPGRQMKVQWMATTIAEQVNLGGKTPARTA